MNKGRDRDVERLLGSVTPASAPPGLRERIMGAAASDLSRRAVTPLARACLGACAAFALIIAVADWALGRAENKRLAAFAGPEPRTEALTVNGTAFEDIFSGMPLPAKELALRHAAQPRSGLRSWDLLKEDFDGGHNAENHN